MLNKPRSSEPPTTKAQLAAELYVAMQRLYAEPELLAIVGRWADATSDENTLAILREYNARGMVRHRPQ